MARVASIVSGLGIVIAGCAEPSPATGRPLAPSGPSTTAKAPDAAPPATATATATTADPAISVMLDEWHAAAATADETRYFAHFAPYGVFLGTDGSERWTVPAFRTYAHPHFAKGKAWTMRAKHREVTMRGDIAWFDEDLETEKLGPARGSGVVVREGTAWKIAQYNLSIPIPNERFKEARAAIDGTSAGNAPCPPPSKKGNPGY